nr:carbohydrate ABC transporter permease [Jiangella anatolica]
MSGSRVMRPVWMERPSVASHVSKAAVLVAVCLLVAFPFLVIVSTSLSSAETLDRTGGYVVFPTSLDFSAYEAILSGGIVTRAVLVSVGVTVAGTAVSLVATVLLAYGLSRRGSFAHRTLLAIVLLTFLFPPGVIPSYLVVKELGLLDTYASLVLPTAVSAFNVVIMRGFFMNVPQELLDSARIDGAGEWRVLLTIVLPLSKAVLAVIGLFYAVAYWNAFFTAMLYLNDTAKWPLQLLLRTYVLGGSTLGGSSSFDPGGAASLPPVQSVQMAVVVIALVPILCVYPFLQRHFATGVLTGAVKG